MKSSPLIQQMYQHSLAMEMIELGARPVVMQHSLDIPYGRLARLYREKTGESLPKGAIPYAEDWFLRWRPNIHSSLFHAIYRKLEAELSLKPAVLLIRSYRFYLDWQQGFRKQGVNHKHPLLSITRAWILLRYLEGQLLQTSSCKKCGQLFIDHANSPQQNYVCGLCMPPSRAGSQKMDAVE